MLRRRMVMTDQVDSNAKYPLVQSTFYAHGIRVTSEKGNHIKILTDDDAVYRNNAWINLSNVGLTNYNFNYNGVYNKPEIFTIPEESHCVLNIKNILGGDDKTARQIGFVKSNSTEILDLIEGYINEGKNITTEKEISSEFSVGCLFIYGNIRLDLEFDIELYVNGERWI